MSKIISRKKKVENKEEDKEQGVRRLLWLLVFVVLLLAVMVIIPLIQNRESKAEEYACTLAIRRAQDAVLIEFMSKPDMTARQAAFAIDQSNIGRDDLCPSGGDYYLVPQGGSWRVTCGLHEEDKKLRTQLNATRVLEILQDQLEARRRLEIEPERVTIIKINGIPLDIIMLAGDNGLRRGTDYSIDFDGVVSFYTLNASGEVNWFVYADENHAAV